MRTGFGSQSHDYVAASLYRATGRSSRSAAPTIGISPSSATTETAVSIEASDAPAKSWTDFGSQSWAWDAAVQPDSKIVAVGSSMKGEATLFALARYKRDGSLDPTFGHAGKVLTRFGPDFMDEAGAVAIGTDGSIVAAGMSYDINQRSEWSKFGIARYTADGRLDSTFGTDGKVVTGFAPRSEEWASDLAIQDDGRIVAAGSTDATTEPFDFALIRYTGNGQPRPDLRQRWQSAGQIRAEKRRLRLRGRHPG